VNTTTTTAPALTHAEQNAAGHIETITTAHEAWEFCQDDNAEARELSREARRLLREHGYDGDNRTTTGEAIAQAMGEQALSVDVRSGWSTPGELEPEEYQVLLSTGGPALRIIGRLDRGQPSSARMQHQDWSTPWIEWAPGANEEALLWFAGLFWFGA